MKNVWNVKQSTLKNDEYIRLQLLLFLSYEKLSVHPKYMSQECFKKLPIFLKQPFEYYETATSTLIYNEHDIVL